MDKPNLSAEEVYIALGRHIAAMPALDTLPLGNDDIQWMARAHALLVASGDVLEAGSFSEIMRIMYTNPTGARVNLVGILYRTLALAELAAPASARGAFIPVGRPFDAMAQVGRVLNEAKQVARIIDPYLDQKVLVEFATMAAPNLRIELLADEASVKPGLLPSVLRWKQQYTVERELEARLARPRALHDRLIIIDGVTAWTLTQSLNSFATRSPATIVRVDDDTARLKAAGYEELWATASPLG